MYETLVTGEEENNMSECGTSATTSERKVAKEHQITPKAEPAKVQPHQGNISYSMDPDEFIDKTTSRWTSPLWRYSIENEHFAKGAYGKVLLAEDVVAKKKVVIKKIPRTVPERMINNELKAGKFLGRHPNIVRLHQYLECNENHYLVFEYVQAPDMFCFLEKRSFAPMPEDDARKIILQIFQALEHIHAHSISHRDVKLENILISEKLDITLIDFGLCGFVEENRLLREWCGSDNYLAPEICRRVPYDGYKADIFSSGVVLFALLFGVFPFDNLRVNANLTIVKPIKVLKVSFPSSVQVSDSAKDLVQRMLHDDPGQRLTLKEAMAHEWMKAGELPSPVESPSNSGSCESVPQRPVTIEEVVQANPCAIADGAVIAQSIPPSVMIPTA